MNETVGCTERTLIVYFVILLFVLCSVSVSALKIVFSNSLCEVLQNGIVVRFSKRTDCWCAFSWSICNQNGHFIKCIQSSSSQSYDGVHKSWEVINS